MLYNQQIEKWSHSLVSDSLWPHGLQPTRLLHLWDFPGKSTGVCCHFLLQGIFPSQGSNPGFPHCRQMLYPLSHQGSQSANWYSYYSYNCILIAFQILWHYSIEEGRVYALFPWTWVGLWLLWPIEFRKAITDFFFFLWYSCLHCCVDFCCTMTWISYMCTYIPSLLDFQPNTPSHPSRSAQSTKMSFLCYTAGSH